MFRISLALIATLSLVACGGGNRNASFDAPVRVDLGGLDLGIEGDAPDVLPFATGPIQKACQADGRKAASRARCGCVQAVADRSLSSADQRRGAGYFKNPARLQEVRQSDNAGNERFWKAWKAFGQSAAAVCKDS